MGPSSLTITCQALSVDSPEKYGRSPAVHSPQPVSPSDCISASRILRSRVTPKLVSNGRTSGIWSSRRTMPSILICFLRSLMFDARSGLGQGSQLESSVSFCIPGETQYRKAPGKCMLKLPAVLQLNGESAFPFSSEAFHW